MVKEVNIRMTMYELFLSHSRGDRALRTLVANQLEPLQITMMQWLLLGVVNSAPKQGVSMSTIAQELGITLPQVTALMNDLDKKRFVKLKTQKSDRRSRHALMSPKGEDVFKESEKRIDAGLSDLFPVSARKSYVETLEKLSKSAEALAD